VRIWRAKKNAAWLRGVGPSYAYKSGGPILRDEPRKWRYLNGIRVGRTWILFRRHQLLSKKVW
jgi:hypothetical protein